MRAVLDTNVLVSALASPLGVPGKIYRAWVDGKFILVISDYILNEFARVAIEKLKFQHKQIQPIVNLFYTLGEIVEPLDLDIPGIDTQDAPIIGTAVAGAAEVIVTGDQKLLKLKAYKNVTVISPRKFLEILKQN